MVDAHGGRVNAFEWHCILPGLPGICFVASLSQHCGLLQLILTID
jgi:hypothetical protein